MISLKIIRGPESGRIIALDKQTIVVGRNPDCDVVLPMLTVGRQHFKIFWDGHCWHIENLGSRGGFWVNDRQIMGRSHLQDGDLIRVCAWEIAFAENEPDGIS